jgi:hypothetical protein
MRSVDARFALWTGKMGVAEATVVGLERTPRKWCDTKSLVASGLAGWGMPMKSVT